MKRTHFTPFLHRRSIACFSMEISLHCGIPTYSGGIKRLPVDSTAVSGCWTWVKGRLFCIRFLLSEWQTAMLTAAESMTDITTRRPIC